MRPVKLLIIQVSTTSSGDRLATIMGQAAVAVGAEVRIRGINATAFSTASDCNLVERAQHSVWEQIYMALHDDLVWADAYLFDSSSHVGAIASYVQHGVATVGPGNRRPLANAVAAGITTIDNPAGRPGSAMDPLHGMLHDWGTTTPPSIVQCTTAESPDQARAWPVTAGDKTLAVETIAAARYLARRVVLGAQEANAGRDERSSMQDTSRARGRAIRHSDPQYRQTGQLTHPAIR